MNVNTIYTSVSANRTPGVLDWGVNGLICYGAANAVVIAETKVNFCSTEHVL